MGGFWSFSRPRSNVEQQQEEARYGFFDCSPGCRASESDLKYCTCRCRGINHGALVQGRVIRPIPLPQGTRYVPSIMLEPEDIPQIAQQQALPNLTPSPSPSSIPQARGSTKPEYERLGKVLGKKLGRSFKHALAGYSQTELNDQVFRGLRYQFNEERVNAIIDRAYSIRMSQTPIANTPELYELFESGDIDLAAEKLGVRWVIGKPKRRGKRNA